MKIASVMVAFALLVFACSSTTTTTTTTDPDAGAAKPDAGKDAGSSTSSSSGSASGDDDDDAGSTSTCSDETTQDACVQCCAGENSAGAQVYQAAAIACICKDENCKTDCSATYCAATPKNPDATCDTCFKSKQDACQTDLETACKADQGCIAFNNCIVDSGCQSKN